MDAYSRSCQNSPEYPYSCTTSLLHLRHMSTSPSWAGKCAPASGTVQPHRTTASVRRRSITRKTE
eukprot:3882154-Pleurochrysis_carterae.AAC.1